MTEETGLERPSRVEILPPAQAFSDLCTRPNTIRLIFTYGTKIDVEGTNGCMYKDKECSLNDPLLLAADTPDERNEWCTTINTAVDAIAAHQEQLKLIEDFRSKQQHCGKSKHCVSKFGTKKKYCS